ncbi:MAG: DUF2752 domain-containing protein [Lysobacter sp.]|nr:DUF2752 domain-containing protein [Lysobacter sp.]
MTALRQPRLWHATAVAAAFAAVGAGVWLLRRVDPNAPDSPLPGCLFFHFTGLYCPGCGSTRALHGLVHGDLAQAWAMNPLLFVVIPALPMLIAHGMGYRLPLPKRAIDGLLSAKFWLILLFGYWIARNLPWWPFSWLAPG